MPPTAWAFFFVPEAYFLGFWHVISFVEMIRVGASRFENPQRKLTG